MDGLVLKINSEFLKFLMDNGLNIDYIKVNILSRDYTRSTRKYIAYSTIEEYNIDYSSITSSFQCLNYAGNFAVIDTISLTNKNLPFYNEYRWSNIIDEPETKLETIFEFNSFRNSFYESEVERYRVFTKKCIDAYRRIIDQAIQIRLYSYVDPNYVDYGYVLPNSEIIDPLTYTLKYTIN
jgi:hypothetical protein